MNTNLSKAALVLAWIAALLSISTISWHYSGESTQFLGVADDQEQIIRFTKPVQIVGFGFVTGQMVTTGDLVVEVQRPELKAQLQIVEEKIHALKFDNRETRATMQSEIVGLQANLQASLTDLDSQIRRLKGQEKATQSILKAHKGGNNAEHGGSLTAQDISSLQVRRRAVMRATGSKVLDLKSRLEMPERSVDAQIAELDKQLQDLDRQKTELSVFADIDGRIGSIHFKVGDTVPPYQPIATVHGSKPSFIKGYIHENVLNGVRLKQTVWVRSANSNGGAGWQEGVVESLGSRIVEFPERLKVNPLAQAWGREVIIELPNHNSLLLGEKVKVQLDRPIERLKSLNAYAKEIYQ